MAAKATKYSDQAGWPVPSQRYIGNGLITLTTTINNQGHRVFRGMFYDLGRPYVIDQVWIYLTAGGTAGTGDGTSAFRIYPAKADGSEPATGTAPIVAVGGTAMDGAAGDRTWTLNGATGLLLPRFFWAGMVHNCQGGNPTTNGPNSTGSTRLWPNSDASTPAATPAIWTGRQWTEAVYAASNTWANAAVTNTTNPPLFWFRVK